ncbi:hypothetical protein [Streptomyces sp. NPDC007083]|uniref:hypothetical protein n=1 Tax=unclassified Streptomyces TaxID=2593676 RepID=UPI0033D5077D
MAVFMLQLAHGEDVTIEADAVGRAPSGQIVLERTDRGGRPERVRTYPAGTVTAVFRRSPVDGGGYGWVPQRREGTWWCY